MPDEFTVSSVEPFRDQGLIADVLHVVKSGKEATVCCCNAASSTDFELCAAKVYRPRNRRGFKNDAVYWDGRVIRDARQRRAFLKKTRKGREVQFSNWVVHEFDTLRAFHSAGADVPKPYATAGPAILMEFVGNGSGAAPMLKDVTLSSQEAKQVLGVLLWNLELWLSQDVVHADLSPYNILCWDRKPVVIDFPQAVDARSNRNAFSLLSRDVENVCRFLAKFGAVSDPINLCRDLWHRYLRAEL